MKTAILLGAGLAALIAGTAQGQTGRPQLGSFGLDVSGMDRSVKPGDDFYRFANGAWADKTEIPADRSVYGMFVVLDDLSQARTREIIELAANNPAGNGQKVGDYFASFMDEAGIEAKGAAPLKADLARLDAVTDKTGFVRLLGQEMRAQGPTLFDMGVDQDIKAPDSYIAYLGQSGLGLPDRDYYVVDNPRFAEIRDKYIAHIARMLVLAGTPEAAATAKAQGIYAFEKKLAEVQWSRADSRDTDKIYNKWTPAELAQKAPGFDWATLFATTGLNGQSAFVVQQPSAFTGMARIYADTPLDTLKDWLAFHIIVDRAPVLSKAFVDANFDFRGRTLSGQPQIQERWKRGVNQVNNAMGEAVGQLYVAKYFPPEAKAAADELVRNLIAAMDNRLANLSWMAPETKQKAREKLAAFTPKIGYPDKWRDYAALRVVRGDAYGNAERAAAFEYDRNIAKLGQPVDRGEWFMTPMTINAYANPPMNEIVFPAAILQPPFFDPNADPAINYGAIGVVIGHEISHHFDDQGRKYDKTGKLADWWTPQDVARFKAFTDRVVKQYAEYMPLPGHHVNGELTLGENMADLAGLFVAHDAWIRSLKGKPAPVIDGFTGEQRFFLGFAQVWRQKMREPALLERLTTDPHTPGDWRPYVVRNNDDWYKAFDVKPGTKFYLPPDQRIKVW
ncbi:M13 family metallopeptidase [Sphingomonas quercus]|uniref:M13 family peptidase n=1 Tax=Sphingomonas quercus TaxID=2842451 RepID=A0ABS6BKG2_9SPHN|nr:M13-type metalloendopeptidase [Sphingomonas quercus]MBU3078795.1 M13 family peptidase [Sphingomonas quercus]